jgi:hypothetical protein
MVERAARTPCQDWPPIPPDQAWRPRRALHSIAAMAWTRHGIRQPRRRRGDWRPLPPQAAAAPPGDRLAQSPAADPWLALNREIDRCRRYRHPLALVRVVAAGPGEPTPPAARRRREGRQSRRRRQPLAELAATVAGAVRSGDATWIHGSAAFVLAPETDVHGGEALGHRIRALAAEALDMPVEVRIAAFPEDGLTGHALQASISARGRRFRTPRGAPSAAPPAAPASPVPGAWAADA